MKKLYPLFIAVMVAITANAQPCTPSGDETSFGTSDVWIGYLYDNADFTSYHGYTNEGSPGHPNFDQNFGGDQVNYATNGCDVYTESFSARYKLTKTFTPGSYQFIVGADDGYRLSLDGGATWVINRFWDQSYNFTVYTATLNGTYDLVIEYYENGGGNRLSFSVSDACTPTGDESLYGTGNTWNGYIYQGTNFNNFNGTVTEGSGSSPDFNENFGGDNTLYVTSSCLVATEQFSARYRLQKTFAANNYIFTVGGDDGYRLSLDGGATWVIDRWWDQGYNTTAYSTSLSGTYNLVLEYYENGGGNQLSFNVALNSLLPVQLSYFDGKAIADAIQLNWKTTAEINTDYYQVERSANGTDFHAIGKVFTGSGLASGTEKLYGCNDASPFNGSNYYRLRMVDKDGKVNLSAIIKILFTQQQRISITPAIVTNQQALLQTGFELKNSRIDMFDMTGRKVKTIVLPSTVSPGTTIRLQLPAAPKGSYVLICSAGANIKAKKMIIVQ